MSLPRPRGVLFDFADTLLHEGPVDFRAGASAVLRCAVETGGCTADELADATAHLMADLNPRRQASHLELPLHTVSALLYEPRGIRFTQSPAEIEWAFWSAATAWTLEPGVREALEFLRGAGVPCGVVSNSMFREQTIARQLALSGLAGLVPWVITSTEYVVRKPHPLLFALAAQRLGLPAGDLWFVGDSLEWDVRGAAAAGLVPIWYNPAGAADAGSGPAARAVASWEEFVHLARGALGATA